MSEELNVESPGGIPREFLFGDFSTSEDTLRYRIIVNDTDSKTLGDSAQTHNVETASDGNTCSPRSHPK